MFAPTKFVPLSDTISETIPLLAIIRLSAAMKWAVEALLTSSRLMALVTKHTNTAIQALVSLGARPRLNLIMTGPA